MIRDNIKDSTYFSTYIEKNSARIKKSKDRLEQGIIPEARIEIVNKSIGSSKLRILISQYSIGAPIHKVREQYIELLDEFDKYWISGHVLFKHEGKELAQYLDYDDMLWMLSLGYLFNVPNEKFKILADLIDRDNVIDLLYECILSAKLEDRKQVIKESYEFGWKLFKSLRESIQHELSKDQRIDLIDKFLNNEWRTDHKEMMKDVNKDITSYYGAWSFESAAIASIFKLDCSSFIENRYFPKNLVQSIDVFKQHIANTEEVIYEDTLDFYLSKDQSGYIINVLFHEPTEIIRSFKLLDSEIPEEYIALSPLAADIRLDSISYTDREIIPATHVSDSSSD